MQKCELEKEIFINAHRELIKNDVILTSKEGAQVIENSEKCDKCNYKQKCLDSMKKLGILYTEKKTSKNIKIKKFDFLKDMNNQENEYFSLTYKNGNLFVFDKEKNKNVLVVYADMIMADEYMGAHVINDLIRNFGYLLKDA